MSITKLAGNFTGIAGKLDTLAKAAKGLLCLPSILKSFALTNPKNILKSLTSIAGVLVNSIAGAVLGAIEDRINQLLGLVTLPLRLLQKYVQSLLNIVDNVKQILRNVKNKAADLKDFLKNTQNCSIQTANFMNCIATAVQKNLTKAVLAKIKNPLSKLDNQFDKLQKQIQTDVFRAGGLLEQHVGREIAAVEKITKQLSILTR